jgi:hypothetical protein
LGFGGDKAHFLVILIEQLYGLQIKLHHSQYRIESMGVPSKV